MKYFINLHHQKRFVSELPGPRLMYFEGMPGRTSRAQHHANHSDHHTKSFRLHSGNLRCLPAGDTDGSHKQNLAARGTAWISSKRSCALSWEIVGLRRTVKSGGTSVGRRNSSRFSDRLLPCCRWLDECNCGVPSENICRDCYLAHPPQAWPREEFGNARLQFCPRKTTGCRLHWAGRSRTCAFRQERKS